MFAHHEMARLANLPSMVAPVPVDGRFFDGVDGFRWRQALEIPVGADVIGAVGKIADGRGFGLFIECLARLPASVYGIIVGVGELRPRLEALAESLGVRGRLRWAGYQEEELPALFGALDIVLVTAMGSDHGHRIISEAQAAAKPVVSVDFAGVSDLIEHGLSGVLCRQSVGELASALQSLFDDRERLACIGACGREVASERSFEKIGENLRKFLGNV